MANTSINIQKQAAHLLQELGSTPQSLAIKVNKEELKLPDFVTDILLDALKFIADGKTVAILSKESEVSTQEAANILNVSRPFVIKLINEKQLPFRKVGTHRRILLEHVLAYKKKMERTRSESLAFLTQQAQDLNLGY
ncbi:MAG: helix-turn-helix domain-containing protein [Saprospiraceae bacterium]